MSDSVEVENPTLGKLKLTGQSALLILSMVAAGAGAFGIYLHFEHEAKAGTRETSLVRAFEKMTESQERMVQAQREQNCLIALPQDRRERELMSANSFCKQITR